MNTTIVLGHGGLEGELRERLGGAARVAIVGIGDELQVHDRLGILAGREIEALHLPGARVFLAGTVPEAVTGPIRRFHPEHILLLDAADLGERPGTVAVIGPERVVMRAPSTHSLPLSVVIRYLEESLRVPVTLIGIQPDLASDAADLTAAEEAGLARIVGCMQSCLSSPGPKPSRSAGSRAL